MSKYEAHLYTNVEDLDAAMGHVHSLETREPSEEIDTMPAEHQESRLQTWFTAMFKTGLSQDTEIKTIKKKNKNNRIVKLGLRRKNKYSVIQVTLVQGQLKKSGMILTHQAQDDKCHLAESNISS